MILGFLDEIGIGALVVLVVIAGALALRLNPRR